MFPPSIPPQVNVNESTKSLFTTHLAGLDALSKLLLSNHPNVQFLDLLFVVCLRALRESAIFALFTPFRGIFERSCLVQETGSKYSFSRAVVYGGGVGLLTLGMNVGIVLLFGGQLRAGWWSVGSYSMARMHAVEYGVSGREVGDTEKL